MKSEGRIPLVNLNQGEEGVVVDLLGGRSFKKKLDALGIRIGKEITKISDMVMKGPVTIKIDNTKVAIGRGMAKKIVVDKKES